MNDFTASNGMTLSRVGDAIVIPDAISQIGTNTTVEMGPQTQTALVEFFQAEADERLGRWRWPKNPDYVVYPRNDYVSVLCETRCESGVLYRRDDPVLGSEGAAARAYFDAHPEPKPWHEAKPGEVWAILDASAERVVFVHEDATIGGLALVTSTGLYIPLNAPEIVSARRVWPMEVPY